MGVVGLDDLTVTRYDSPSHWLAGECLSEAPRPYRWLVFARDRAQGVLDIARSWDSKSCVSPPRNR